jgi:hypothetical protein
MAELAAARRYADEGLSIGRTARLIGRTRAALGAAASRHGIRFAGWEDNGAPFGNTNRKGKHHGISDRAIGRWPARQADR